MGDKMTRGADADFCKYPQDGGGAMYGRAQTRAEAVYHINASVVRYKRRLDIFLCRMLKCRSVVFPAITAAVFHWVM